MNIGITEKGRLFWDLTQIENVTKDIHDQYGETPYASFLRDRSIISQGDESVKKRFSLKEPVEKRCELFAVHNIETGNILEMVNTGGFPMPSIAVVKESMGHSMYGGY